MSFNLIQGALALGAVGLLSVCELCKSPVPVATRTAYASATASPASVPFAAEVQVLETVTLDVQGMTCGGCAIGVRTVLNRLAGVSKSVVSYETHQAVVTYDPSKVTVAQMIAAIATLKYTATPVTPKAAPAGA
ncbi:MAG: cation transporter [Gemmatimonadaceae bacterium]